jgi:sensor histidine kinase YesM
MTRERLIDRLPGEEHHGRLAARWSALMFAITSLLALLTALQCHAVRLPAYPAESMVPTLIYPVAFWLWWGVVASLMFWVGLKWPLVFRFSTWGLRDVVAHILLATLLGAVHLGLMLQVVIFIGKYWTGWNGADYLYINRFGLEVLLYGFTLGIVGLVQAKLQAQRAAVQSLELEKQLSQAQLKALQMQIEPHFLFNTLNAVTTLVELGRNKEASETLAHLNKILRSTLQRSAPEKIPFAQELQVVESYLAIQQVRFADRLHVKIEATPEALEGLVPCFLLQPIIENAIRHGIAPLEGYGVLETSVERVGDMLRMRVRDNGPGLNGASNGNGRHESSNGYGIGMKNTRERLAFFYPQYEFVARDAEGGGCEVMIQIPYERRAYEA